MTDELLTIRLLRYSISDIKLPNNKGKIQHNNQTNYTLTDLNNYINYQSILHYDQSTIKLILLITRSNSILLLLSNYFNNSKWKWVQEIPQPLPQHEQREFTEAYL